jgi:prevent-host-death family protein
MANIPATEFKAKCLALMNRVAERQESFVITKRGKPVARLVPLERKAEGSIFGWLRARGSIQGDIVSPAVPSEAWETLKEWNELVTPERLGRTGRRRSMERKTRSRR